jgi:hypothetical protein
MARKLKMDPEYWKDFEIGCLRASARLLLVALVAHADDDGRIAVAPSALRARAKFFTRWTDEDLRLDVAALVPALGDRATFTQVDGRWWFEFEREYFASWCWKEPIPLELRRQVFERDGGACLACGSTARLAADHIVPESRGGRTVLGNLQTLCSPCNSTKNTKTIDYRKAASNG